MAVFVVSRDPSGSDDNWRNEHPTRNSRTLFSRRVCPPPKAPELLRSSIAIHREQ